MKTLLILLLCAPLMAIACNANKPMIDKLVLSGDVSVTFKPNGTASTVDCNPKKYTAKQCDHVGEHIFDYYEHHRKGHK